MSAYGKYQNAYKRASVNTMDQNKLIVMLYDGAIKNITFGVEQMRLGNVEKTHTHLVKSKNIVAGNANSKKTTKESTHLL